MFYIISLSSHLLQNEQQINRAASFKISFSSKALLSEVLFSFTQQLDTL